ncbi:4'-phosphopantetheinyl transferase family protein, partial [Undibacterium sp.]|uniref:4'-phosphopantetheinyl transferase family protein n=1 Tax=Undibacterium sp. TaxID=1914977 RepID=UPI002C25AAB6
MSDSVIRPVYPWPAARQAAVAALKEQGLAVISVEVAASDARDTARQMIRRAVSETLASTYGYPQEQLRLLSAPGQPVRVNIPGHHLNLSLSHEPGLSLAVIGDGGAVGVDLMRIDEELDWEPVAQLYLGPELSAAIGRRPQSQQAYSFAQAWTEQEARLKCRGLSITEWSPELAHLLAQCRLAPLDLP